MNTYVLSRQLIMRNYFCSENISLLDTGQMKHLVKSNTVFPEP